VQLGPGCVIVAQAGISGSTKLDHTLFWRPRPASRAPQDRARRRIAAQSGVMRDVEPGAEVGGSPAVSMRQWLRQVALLGAWRGEKAVEHGHCGSAGGGKSVERELDVMRIMQLIPHRFPMLLIDR